MMMINGEEHYKEHAEEHKVKGGPEGRTRRKDQEEECLTREGVSRSPCSFHENDLPASECMP